MGIIVADALPIVNSSAKRREYPQRRSLEDSKNLLQIWAWFKQFRFWVRRGGLICGSIVGGRLKSEGFGDGYAAFGVRQRRTALEAATQD